MDKISISRWSDSLGKTGIEITIKNDKYELLYIGDMTMENFARCVTGQSMINIERDTQNKMRFGNEQDGGRRMSEIVYYWYTFADGYRCCVRGFSSQEFQNEVGKHGMMVKKERA